MTSFSYTEISEAVLRQLSPILRNAGAKIVSADEMGDKINDKLTDEITDEDTGKPQNSNKPNFKAFGPPRTTKEDIPIPGPWKSWDNSACPADDSERNRDCIMNNNQDQIVDSQDCKDNVPGTTFVEKRECCTDRQNYSEEDETKCECMYPWSADANGDCNTCIALRPMQFLCYICKY